MGKTEPEIEMLGLRLESKLPGKLFALLEDNSVHLQYEATSDDDEPPRVFVDGDKQFDGSWKAKPNNRWLCIGAITLKEDTTSFRVGAEKFNISR